MANKSDSLAATFATLRCDEYGEEGTIRFSERFKTEDDVILIDFLSDWIDLLQTEHNRLVAKVANGPNGPAVAAFLGLEKKE